MVGGVEALPKPSRSCAAPVWPASPEHHPEHSIGAAQAKPSARGLLKDGKLVSQGKDFNLEFNPRAKAGPKGGDDRNRDRAHGRTRYQVRAVVPKVARTEYLIRIGTSRVIGDNHAR